MKNLLILIKDRKKIIKDWKLNNLNIVLKLSKLDANKRFIILAYNKIGYFFEAKLLQINWFQLFD